MGRLGAWVGIGAMLFFWLLSIAVGLGIAALVIGVLWRLFHKLA